VPDFDFPLIQPLVDKLSGWWSAGVAMLPNLIIAIVLLGGAVLIARQAHRAAEAGFRRMLDNLQIASLLARTTHLLVIGVGIFLALSALELDKTVTSLLAGAGVVGLAIGFAAQKLLANLMSGVLIAAQRPYRIGHWIEAADNLGKVEAVGLRATRLVTPDGRRILVPNGGLYDSNIVNWSASGRVRVDVEVGCSYVDDIQTAIDVTCEALRDLERSDGTGVETYATEFGGSSINLVARFWVDFADPSSILIARSKAMVRIQRAWDDAGLSIPITTLDFGIDGGERLAQHLREVRQARRFEAGAGEASAAR
jgi:small conductance mechanosensitive channel